MGSLSSGVTMRRRQRTAFRIRKDALGDGWDGTSITCPDNMT